MSEHLSAVVRSLAQEEGIAAEFDRPYTAAMRDTYVRDVRRRRTAVVSALALAAVAVGGVGAFGLDRLTRDVPPVDLVVTDPTPTATARPTSEPTPSQTPTQTPTATVPPSPTPTGTPPPVVEPEDETPPPPPPAPPGAVTGVRAGPGGGSGEIMVWWEPAPGATGYRVYRSDAAGGPYVAAASIDMDTGAVTVEYGGWYEHIWMVAGIQSPTAIEYGEVVSPVGYYRVAAFNDGGEGAWSSAVCGQPPYATAAC